MRSALVAFAAGCGLLQLQAGLPPWYVLGTCLAGAAVLLIIAWAGAARWRLAAAIPGALLLGFCYAAAFAHVRLADALPPEWEGRDIAIVGIVASLPQVFERGERFEFEVERVLTESARAPRRLQLAWYGADEVAGVRPGERWQLTVRLKRPHGGANPHGFDYEAWLLQRGIRATGYVRPARAESTSRLIAPFVWSLSSAIDRSREILRERLGASLGGAAHAGVIIALAIGDQRAIDGDDWRLFTRTGVGHLMSISGLHVTMIAALAGALAFALWRRSETLCLALPAQRAAAAAGLCAAFAYCLLAGFAIPAQRTLFMLAVAAWSLWRGWSGAGLRVLAVALALVCVLDPWAPLSAGFWLSFAAVAILMVAASGAGAQGTWVRRAAAAQLAVSLGLVPLTLALFQQVSVAGPLANALAIPVVSFVVTPLALAACVVPVDAIALAAHAVLAVLMQYLEWLGSSEFAVWQRAAAPAWTVVLALCGAVWLLLPLWWQWRVMGAVWMLPLLAHPSPAPAPGDLWLTVLDVGQGMAVVARTATRTLVVDAGPTYSPEADGGNRVVVPFLRGEGVRRLDGAVLTHDDTDHTGGASSTLAAVETDWLASSLEDAQQSHLRVRERRRCAAGDSWAWDGVHFEFVHPAAADYRTGSGASDNAKSCVLSIRARGRRALLAADIEADVEKRLAHGRTDLASDLLVVPHHGSRTSSTEEFLDAVAPRHAVIPVGYRNRFRHPSPEVLDRYARRHIPVSRTDFHGAVLVRFDAGGVSITTWRQARPRYWHWK